MKLKKFFAGVVAAAMMLTMGATAAFAATGTVSVSETPVTKFNLTHTYEVVGGTAPGTTFTFKLAGTKVEGNTALQTPPAFDPSVATIDYQYTGDSATTRTKNFEFELSKLKIEKVGIYYYTITEEVPQTKVAGVSYDNPVTEMKVTAVNGTNGLEYYVALKQAGEKKSASTIFKNTYSAGSLDVQKLITGKLGDKTANFEFKVTLKAAAGTSLDSTFTITEGKSTSKVTNEDGSITYTFNLTNEEHAVFSNLPYGVTYTVEETKANQDGYTTTFAYSNTSEIKSIAKAEADTVTVTNSKGDNEIIDMGVILDNAPYIALLTIAAFGAVALVLSKRRRNEE